MRYSSVVTNSVLLLLICATMLISTALKMGVNWVTYLTLFSSVLLIAKTMVDGRRLINGYVIIMTLLIILHFLLTPDRIATTLLLLVTLYLYEAVDKGIFSYKIVLYPIIVVFIIGFITTFPNFLNSITVAHTDRSDLYRGFFQNSNTFAAFCIMALMCVILYLKPSKIKFLLVLIIIFNIYSSGSRNAMLFMIISLFFYILHKSKYSRFTYLCYITFLLCATYYLVFIEMNYTVDFTIMGKSADSAGRSAQLIYVIKTFPVKLFGCGKDVIDNTVNIYEDYSIHNFYINSLYSIGLLPIIGYLYYIYRIWKSIPNIMAKSFLLAFNIYFFFEPGTCYYLLFTNVAPIIIVLLSRQLPSYENHGLKMVKR